jgi:hypothetical protein
MATLVDRQKYWQISVVEGDQPLSDHWYKCRNLSIVTDVPRGRETSQDTGWFPQTAGSVLCVCLCVCGQGLAYGDAKYIMAILLATRDRCSVNMVCGSPRNLRQNLRKSINMIQMLFHVNTTSVFMSKMEVKMERRPYYTPKEYAWLVGNLLNVRRIIWKQYTEVLWHRVFLILGVCILLPRKDTTHSITKHEKRQQQPRHTAP